MPHRGVSTKDHESPAYIERDLSMTLFKGKYRIESTRLRRSFCVIDFPSVLRYLAIDM